MPTPVVDSALLNPLVEIVIRAGDTSVESARLTLQQAYLAQDPNYPDTIGFSTLFRQGATIDELAREGSYPHRKISFSVIGKIREELQKAGYELVLFVTPTKRYPDHHALAVSLNTTVDMTLSDAAADALILAFTIVDNPYRP